MRLMGLAAVAALILGVVAASPEQLGVTEVLPHVDTQPWRLRAQPVVTQEPSKIGSVSVYTGNGGLARFGLYSDKDGHPDTLLVETGEVAVPAEQGWRTYDFESPLIAHHSQTLWVAWLFSEETAHLRWGGGSPGRVTASSSWRDGLPVEFGAGVQANFVYSLYLDYERYAPVDPEPLPDDPPLENWSDLITLKLTIRYHHETRRLEPIVQLGD